MKSRLILFCRLAAALLGMALLGACSSLAPPRTPTLQPLEIQGQAVFESYCARCHEKSGETVIVGPSLAGIATRGGERIAGMDARAYILNSILTPDAYTLAGFPEGAMPVDLKDQISPEDLEAVVAYLMTLK